MSLLFMDGFDHYDVTSYGALKWDVAPNYSAYLPTGGRRGTGCLKVGCGDRVSPYGFFKTLPSTYRTLIVGFAVQFNWNTSQVGQSFFRLHDGATLHVYVTRETSGLISVYRGNGTLLGQYDVVLNLGTWYYLELKATIDDTSGVIQLRVNEYLALNLSGIDTRNGGNASINKIKFHTDHEVSYPFNIDDLYVCDDSGPNNNDFLGDCRIDVVRPNGAGYATNWAPSAGSNYQCVDDALFDNGTDYVSENTVDDIDSYTFSDLPLGVAGIKGIQTNVFAKRTDSGVNTKLKPILRPVSTNYEKTEVTLTSSYYDFTEITELNPETGLAWTKATIDAMEVGLKLTANPLP